MMFKSIEGDLIQLDYKLLGRVTQIRTAAAKKEQYQNLHITCIMCPVQTEGVDTGIAQGVRCTVLIYIYFPRHDPCDPLVEIIPPGWCIKVMHLQKPSKS